MLSANARWISSAGGWSMVGTEILEYKMIRNGFVVSTGTAHLLDILVDEMI